MTPELHDRAYANMAARTDAGLLGGIAVYFGMKAKSWNSLLQAFRAVWLLRQTRRDAVSVIEVVVVNKKC